MQAQHHLLDACSAWRRIWGWNHLWGAGVLVGMPWVQSSGSALLGRCAGAAQAERQSPTAAAAVGHMPVEEAYEVLAAAHPLRAPVRDALYSFWRAKRERAGAAVLLWCSREPGIPLLRARVHMPGRCQDSKDT